ncbi:MAG: ATP-binding protein [Proteobacteria bacterium]|nr:ATP-binding protein [Pseudomonadota bacterium]
MSISRLELGSLKKWALQTRRKPLIIRGARQVGKSTLVNLLAQQTHLDLLTLNFEQQPELADLFARPDPKKILKLLEVQINRPIHIGKTLLFLDEIQGVAKVILPALRYFYEEIPDLHVISTGSLLDFALNEAQFSMPVGRIEYLFMGPLNFEEFLIALGEQSLWAFLNEFQINDILPQSIHNRLMDLLREFLIIGGMPEAVAAFAENRDYQSAERIKHAILNTYRDDFNKYSTPTSHNRIRKVFSALPALVGKRLKYSLISPDEKSVVIANALEKLCLARVAYLIKHSACNGLPLGAQVNEKIFKPLFLDVGLVCTSLGLNLLDIGVANTLSLVNSGAISEQFIGQHLLYLHPSYQEPALYYWVREKKSSSAEVDYVINIGPNILPIEVKAGKSGTLRSLHYFLQEQSLHLGVRVNAHFPQITAEKVTLAGDRSLQYQLLSLPLYFIGQLKRLISNTIGMLL